MGYTIFITEKPSVAQTYSKVLGVSQNGKHNGYIEGHSSWLNKDVRITWAVGHLIAIAPPGKQNEEWEHKNWRDNKKNLPMIPEIWKYVPIPSVYDQFKVVKDIYTRKDTDEIYYAGDSGREGIYIQALIRNQIFKTAPKFPEKVVWIDSQTDDEIKRGIREAKPYSEYLSMVESGYARAKSDYLIGMNLTQAFSITSGYMAVGRVMTPTLAMVVERQIEINNFKEENFFGVNAVTDRAERNIKWKADESSSYYESPLLFNENGFKASAKAEAEKFIGTLNADGKLLVKDVKAAEKTEYAPLLFNLAELQAHCSKAYHISPSDTLAIAQSLYEKKMTTYPRTDARVISTAVAQEIKAKTGRTIPKKYVDDSKITDHYAIIPTNYSATPDVVDTSTLEGKVYRDIVARFYAAFLPAYEYTTYQIVYEALGREHFFESCKVVAKLGWKELYGETIKNPSIPVKGTLLNAKFERNDMKTTPPSAYTTGTLVLTMEKAGKFIEDEELREQLKTCGIGTSSTRAEIIKKLEKNGMISIDKKQKVTATEAGMSIIPIVKKYDTQLVSPEKTAEMEQQLADIVSGKMTAANYEKNLHAYLRETINNILNNNNERVAGTMDGNGGNNDESLGKCPKCGADVVKGQYGYYCKGKCGMNVGKIYGVELTPSQIKKLLSGKSVSVKSKNGKLMEVQPEYEENEYQGKTYFNWKTGSGTGNNAPAGSNDVVGKCPLCGGDVKKGQFGYYCTKKCGMNIAKVFGTELTEKQVMSLLAGESIGMSTQKGRISVHPEAVANEWNGKTYYNWRTEE